MRKSINSKGKYSRMKNMTTTKKLAAAAAGATVAFSTITVPVAHANPDVSGDIVGEQLNMTEHEDGSATLTVDGKWEDGEFERVVGGKEDENGIVWGQGQNGSYMIPLASGGEVQGWCIDAGMAYPKQNGGTVYGEPKEWGGNLSTTEKVKLSLALALGQFVASSGMDIPNIAAIADQIKGAASNIPVVGDQVAGFIDALNIPSDLNKDSLAAGVSGVVHKSGERAGGPAFPAEQRMQGSGLEVYKMFDHIDNVPFLDLAAPVINSVVSFKVREPEKDNYQRMVAMSDVQVNLPSLPGIEWPDLNIPDLNLPDLNIPDINIPDINLPGITLPDRKPAPEEPSTSTAPDKVDAPTTSETPEETTEESTPVSSSATTAPRTTSSEAPAPEAPEAPEEEVEEEENPDIEIRTTAGTKSQNVVEPGATITDTVRYTGLEKGEEYRLVGEAVDKNTGEPTGDSGEVIFEAEEANGDLDVPIQLDSVTAETGDIVVFETLYQGDEVVAEHADVSDEAQTIKNRPLNPEIRTSAENSTGNVIQSGSEVTDTVMFNGLSAGEDYRLETRLMCKETGADTGATQETLFTPETANGETRVEGIPVTDADCQEQVVFEKLYDSEDNLVASHENLGDQAQTVGAPGEEGQTGKKKKKQPSQTPAPANRPIGNGQGPAPAPAPAPAPQQAPRQTLDSVPSGGAHAVGGTIFNR